ncbi:hypothetical protein L195_g003737 [Trifolium pratense]|uniref:Uncharacterized protein n=1 Tax=Trifolium pratense TaxID=57577 RepID=A0A2K3NW30_TRIPR|nr:hypothetical protein L195_g003737 [Trifolium pratense]
MMSQLQYATEAAASEKSSLVRHRSRNNCSAVAVVVVTGVVNKKESASFQATGVSENELE